MAGTLKLKGYSRMVELAAADTEVVAKARRRRFTAE